MNTVRFNITLPRDLGIEVKAAKNTSALIAESLPEKFEREEAGHLAVTLARAYADAAREDRQINQEWDTTVGDGL